MEREPVGLFGFINAIRRSQNVYNNDVPHSAALIDHTDPEASDEFFDVVIGDRQGHQVRIRLRSSDLYLVGWFDSTGTYNYLGNDSRRAGAPVDRHGNIIGHPRRLGEESYGGLERLGGMSRAQINFDQNGTAAAASYLWNAQRNSRQLVATGVLYFTQFISEATRFRPISDTIGWMAYGHRSSDNDDFRHKLDPHLIQQETSWGRESARYHALLEAQNAEDRQARARHRAWRWVRDDEPVRGVWLGPNGVVLTGLLYTVADYARVLNMALSYPGYKRK